MHKNDEFSLCHMDKNDNKVNKAKKAILFGSFVFDTYNLIDVLRH